LFFYYVIIGVVGIFFSSMMNTSESVRRGSVWCLALGMASINLFMVVGGVLGIVSSRGACDSVIYEG
jgi:uncharacterized ion transporter superfamily protein YfcC